MAMSGSNNRGQTTVFSDAVVSGGCIRGLSPIIFVECVWGEHEDGSRPKESFACLTKPQVYTSP